MFDLNGAMERFAGKLALENILNDFYAREFDSVRTVLRETADRGPLLRGLRERGYCLVLATNPIFPAVAVETRLGWVGLRPEDFDRLAKRLLALQAAVRGMEG